MVVFRLVVLLSVLASAHGHTRGAANWEDENALTRHRDANRQLMKDKKVKNLTGNPGGYNNGGGGGGGGGGNNKDKDKGNKDNKKGGGGMNNRQPNNGGGGGGGNGQYVAEQHTCVPFNEEMQARASLSLSDDACRTNSCGGGCCRVYHWLICDTGDEMPQLSCVCNENTRPPPTNPPTDPPTPFPTDAPLTPQPTPGTTSDIRDGAELSVAPQAAGTPAPQPTGTPAPQPTGTRAPVAANVATQPPFMGGASSDSCASGSAHHNNPLFRDFTKCFNADDCPLASECCIHSFCFCGEPDDWTGDCVARTTK